MTDEVTSVEQAPPVPPPAVPPPPPAEAQVPPAQAGVAPEPPAAPIAPAPELSATLEHVLHPPAANAPGEPAPAPTPPAAAPQASEQLPAEWPYRGYTGCQPWEAENPPVLTQNQRMLTSGTNGPEVVELGALLAAVGYTNPIAEGGNPHAIYDASMASAVRQFCAEYGVSEDPAIIAAMTADVVGPWIWETLVRAARKAAS